jgi:hypothetical protein
VKIIALFVMAVALLGFGCKDSEVAQWKSLGTKHRVTVYSGGVAVKVYHSTGNVSNEGQTDGWYFEDAETHRLVEVSGTVVIEQE